jgi:hypothetical protein
MTRPYEEKSDAQLVKSLRDVRYTDSPGGTIPILAEALARLLESKPPAPPFVQMRREKSDIPFHYSFSHRD